MTKYSFQVEHKPGGYYIADCTIEYDDGKGQNFYTSGANKEEVFVMIADAFMTMEDVKCHWWNKILAKLNYFPFKK